MRLLPAAIKDQQRWVTPEALNVAPQWVGQPLAPPARRVLAMAVDLIVVSLLSGVSGLWLIGGLALVLLQLRSRRGATAATGGNSRRVWVGWAGAALIALLALQEAKDQWDTRRDPVAAAARKAERAEEALSEALNDAEDAATKAQLRAQLGALQAQHTASSASAASLPTMSDADRIAQLEAQLAQALKPKPWTQQLQKQFDSVVDAIGLKFGWGIVYFSLLPAWWGGQTVGKKLMRLRVVELTGKPMTVMRCLKRYGGYAAGMATGGLGFAQVIWDPNRQGLQDKAAHTVVLDLRATATATATAQAAAVPAVPTEASNDAEPVDQKP